MVITAAVITVTPCLPKKKNKTTMKLMHSIVLLTTTRAAAMTRLVKKEQKKFPSLKVMKKNKAAVGCSPKSPAHSTDSEEATRKNFNLFI